MMTLDEAIEHCQEKALSCNNKECALEHFQLFKWLQEYKSILEKQGEQKPADKVEPKFKVGDWVVCDDDKAVLQVTKVRDNTYRLVGIDGDVDDIRKWDVEENYHPWTIQDAKAGDVLEFGDHERLVIGIVNFVNNTTGKVDVSCLLEDDKFKVGNYYALDTIKPHPATKEQRDTLEKAMADAGYTFNFEKKKLKKIEQKSAWNEEDEKMLNDAIGAVGAADYYTYDDKQEIETWLKSLKDKYTWKPSDVQLDALHDAAMYVDKSMFPYPKGVLMKLYKQLKKLKGKN